jgi:hypothetical protein
MYRAVGKSKGWQRGVAPSTLLTRVPRIHALRRSACRAGMVAVHRIEAEHPRALVAPRRPMRDCGAGVV